MRKQIYKINCLLLFFIMSYLSYAQGSSRVGINTYLPNATLEVSRIDPNTLPLGQVQGVIFPHIDMQERNNFENVPVGVMIYNTTKNCIDWFDGYVWRCFDGSNVDVSFTPSNQCLNIVADRCYGKTTFECLGYGANKREHDFLYCEIEGPDGRRWLNNNLGAEYARVGSPVFNPQQQKTSDTDYNAYGSLFQWQRKSDGHELVNWIGIYNGQMKYNNNFPPSDSWEWPDNNHSMGGYNYTSWVDNTLNNQGPYDLWTVDKTNNPCPEGYYVPTKDDFEALITAISNNSPGTDLNMPKSGYRGWDINNENALGSVGGVGYYWSSSKSYVDGISDLHSYNLKINSDSTIVLDRNWRANGFSVRCIKEQ